MLTRMLRRQGFYRVRNNKPPVYMKHDVAVGGIYIRIEHNTAMITVRDLGILEEFTRINTRIKQLERFISALDHQAYNTFEWNQAIERIQGVASH